MDHTLVARPGGASPWGGEPAVRAARSCARSSRRLEEEAALTRCWGNHAAAPQTRRPAVPAESPLTPPSALPLLPPLPAARPSPARGPCRSGSTVLASLGPPAPRTLQGPGGPPWNLAASPPPPTTAPKLDRPPRPRGNLDDGLKSGK